MIALWLSTLAAPSISRPTSCRPKVVKGAHESKSRSSGSERLEEDVLTLQASQQASSTTPCCEIADPAAKSLTLLLRTRAAPHPTHRLQGELPHIAQLGETLWGVKLSPPSTEQEQRWQHMLLLSFLASHGGDSAAALQGLRRTLEWRRTYRFTGGFGSLPTDLLLNPVGRSPSPPTIVLDSRKLPAEVYSDPELLVHWWVCMQEALMTRICTSESTSWTLIIDCNALQSHHWGPAARKCATRLADVMAEYYPDQIGETLVINAPVWYQLAWTVVRPFLPRKFVSAVRLSSMKEPGPCIDLTLPGSEPLQWHPPPIMLPRRIDWSTVQQRWFEGGQSFLDATGQLLSFSFSEICRVSNRLLP